MYHLTENFSKMFKNFEMVDLLWNLIIRFISNFYKDEFVKIRSILKDATT